VTASQPAHIDGRPDRRSLFLIAKARVMQMAKRRPTSAEIAIHLMRIESY